jgi:type IV pilus assembly protein PilO
MHILDDDLRRFGRLLHYAGVLATVLCAAAGYSLLHAPTYNSIADTSARIEELKLLVRNAPMMREQHQKVAQKLDQVTTRITDLKARVPRDADAGEFLKELTQLATAENLVIKDFTPGKPESRNGYAEMHVTLKGAGSYASICTFVDRLSKLKRLSKVKDLTVSAEGDSNEYPMTATLIIYFGLRGKVADQAKSPQENRRG